MVEHKRSTRGETLVEALVSILIATLVFSFLTKAVVTAARVNAAIRNEDVSFRLDTKTTEGEGNKTVTITDLAHDGDPVTVEVKSYITGGNGKEVYHYYEYAE